MDRLARVSPFTEALLALGLAYLVLVTTTLTSTARWLAYAAFLYVPVGASWLRGVDFARYGLFWRDTRTTLLVGGGLTAVILAAFAGGYAALVRFTALPLPWFPGFEGEWAALARFALSQFLVVAVAEEFFFRGYLQERFESRWPSRWRLFGAQVGPAWIVAGACFAVGHLADGFNPARLATFIPGLWYGWCRARTGSIYAGAFAHGASNLVIALLQGQSLAGQ